eukprot:tig00001155_g7323.t1
MAYDEALVALARHLVAAYTVDVNQQRHVFEKHYDESCLWSDPWMNVSGRAGVGRQFYMLPRIFSRIDVDIVHVAGSPPGSPARLFIDTKQRYYMRGLPFISFPVRIILKIDLNDQGKVVRQEDCYVYQDMLGAVPFLGYLYAFGYKRVLPLLLSPVAGLLGYGAVAAKSRARKAA